MTRTIVTGGAGFIGSSVVRALVAQGHEVLVVDDLSRGNPENLKGPSAPADLAEIDIRSADDLDRCVTAFRPELVFHLAAQIDVRSSMADPASDAGRNVVGSVTVFAAAHAAGVRRVVNTSTGGAIYGVGVEVPTPETARCEPLSAYGLSKRAVEGYADWFRQAKGLDVVTLRYGNVYGERQDPRGDAGVIALFCDCALRGRRPVVFGDGLQTRDFVHVADVAAANLGAAFADRPLRPVYNVGTGIEVSVRDLVETVGRAAGVDPAAMIPEFRPARAGEIERSCLDVRLARAEGLLGDPTPLVEGLRRTLDWMRGL